MHGTHAETGRSASPHTDDDEREYLGRYDDTERRFAELIHSSSTDDYVRRRPRAARGFEQELEHALAAAYWPGGTEAFNQSPARDSAHLFLQRVLYRINRLKLFWFDELRNYDNERSTYLHAIRGRIEAAWQAWELSNLDVAALRHEHVQEGLLRRAAADVSPPHSARGDYFRHHVSETGYRRLLAIASLDGLVEASQLSRTLGGVANPIHAMMTRLLVEEYGGGRLHRKHSTFFTAMLLELDMRTQPEAYLELTPWEVLAAINHSFLLSERKRFYLRYVGGLLYTEISVPAAFGHYRAAAERLNMSEAARGYWELHIKEDKRHGQWMLHDVAAPLAAKYPTEAWELLLGYDQQSFISDRAGASIAKSVRSAERAAARRETADQSAA